MPQDVCLNKRSRSHFRLFQGDRGQGVKQGIPTLVWLNGRKVSDCLWDEHVNCETVNESSYSIQIATWLLFIAFSRQQANWLNN